MPDPTAPKFGILAVDSHVHLYEWVNLVPMLDAALASFTDAVRAKKKDTLFHGVLVLTEPRTRDTFSRLRTQALQEPPCTLSGDWHLMNTSEPLSLAATHISGGVIYLISGQQVVSREGLEVLSIATEQSIPDRLSIEETINAVRDRDGYPVLPWAVGKWLFGRGRIIDQMIESNGGKPLALGDNGGRPRFWTGIGQFDKARLHALPILNGTDPLPTSETTRTAGSYGTLLCCEFDRDRPAASLLEALKSTTTERIRYGQLEKPVAFLRDQLTLRLR